MLRRFSSASTSSFASSFLNILPSSSSSTSSVTETTEAPLITSLSEALSSPLSSPSPTPSALKENAQIQALHELHNALEELQATSPLEWAKRMGLLARVQQGLIERPDLHEGFIERQGFLSLIGVLATLGEGEEGEEGLLKQCALEGDKSLSMENTSHQREREERTELRYEIVRLVFQIIHLLLHSNEPLQASFRETIGFDKIGEAILMSRLGISRDRASGEEEEEEGEKRMMELMWGFMIGEFGTPSLFGLVLRGIEELGKGSHKEGEGEEVDAVQQGEEASSLSKPTGSPPSQSQKSKSSLIHSLVQAHLSSFSSSSTTAKSNIHYAALAPLLLSLPSTNHNSTLRSILLSALVTLVAHDKRNAIALREVGMASICLKKLFFEVEEGEEMKAVEGEERELWKALLRGLLKLGVGSEESRKVFGKVLVRSKVDGQDQAWGLNEELLGIISNAIKSSRSPSVIQFDHSLHGHSSIISRFPPSKTFPPTSSGYSFLGWISILRPPSPSSPHDRLVIIGAGDPSSKVSFEIEVNPDRRITISTTSTKSPIVFPNFALEVDRLYHVAIVHQRSKFSTSSPCSLYIDGEIVETLKVPYPSSSGGKDNKEVSSWIGTPANRSGSEMPEERTSQVRWELGPTSLIQGDLSEEFIYLSYLLGPRYTSHFQSDTLFRFLSPQSATLLQVRLEASSKEKGRKRYEKESVLLSVARGESIRFREERILSAWFAGNMVGPGLTRKSGLGGTGLSSTTLDLVRRSTANGRILINAAIPHFEEALLYPGILSGDPREIIVKGLDGAIQEIGGIFVVLRLVELSTTLPQLERTVRIFEEAIKDDWRLSEEADKTRAYEILAELLKGRLELFSPEIQDTLYRIVGYCLEDPSGSIIANTSACRFLLLDFGLWSKVEMSLQWVHFDRLRELVVRSEFRDFNSKRLAKMHLTRKLLYSLRTNNFDEAISFEIVEFLMVVVTEQFSTETIRHLATFLTATLCQVIEPSSTSSTLPTLDASPSTFIFDASAMSQGSPKSSLHILHLLHDFLLAPDREVELEKFGKIITTKWMLLFILDKKAHPFSALLSLRILIRILQTQGSVFVAKFTNSTDGFSVLRAALPYRWNFAQIHVALFALMTVNDISKIPLNAQLDLPTCLPESIAVTSLLSSEVLRIFVACLIKGVKVIAKEEQESLDANRQDEPGNRSAEALNASSSSPDLALQDGFEILLDLVGKANRQKDSQNFLLSNPIALGDLASSVLPFLLAVPAHLYPEESTIPVLPLLTPRRNFELPPKPRSTSGDPLLTPRISSPSPSVSPSSKSTDVADEKKTSASVTPILQLLSHQICQVITSREKEEGSRSMTDQLSPSPLAKIMRDTFNAAASSNVAEQISYRTLLLNDIYRKLSRAHITMTTAPKIGSFVSSASDLTFEGWNANINGLLAFVLAVMEKMLNDSLLAAPSSQSTMDSFYRSLNRLTLLALSQGTTEASETIELLLENQLVLFAAQNIDADFFRSLVQRLDAILREPTLPSAISTINFFKLLILQRPVEVEVALGQRRGHQSETRLVEKLIDADDSAFLNLLKDHRIRLDTLQLSWNESVEAESKRARAEAETELLLLSELSRKKKKKADQERKMVRKHRTAIFEWSEGIHDIESTRVAHARQDISDHSNFIEQEWREASHSLHLPAALWEDLDTIQLFQLDFTEGPYRLRSKLEPQPLSI